MARPNPRGIFFDSKHLHEPENNYVCWLDVMGTANQMLRSLPIGANFIYKLHSAVLESHEETGVPDGVRLYPVMDGVYITTQRKEPLQAILNQALCRLAITFLNEPKRFHRFLVRGAIAFGPVYHGIDLNPETTDVMPRHKRVRDSILMGLPMAQAYTAEHDAPPFGIAVDASARAFAPHPDKPFRFIWHDWFRHSQPPIDSTEMLNQLKDYFDWQDTHCNVTGYHKDRIAHHRSLAREFFSLSD